MSELSRGQKVHNPLLHFVYWHVETGGDDSALVETAVEFDYDLLGAVVIDNFEFTNVSYILELTCATITQIEVSIYVEKCNRLKGGSFSERTSNAVSVCNLPQA